jgi:hypothetical protein
MGELGTSLMTQIVQIKLLGGFGNQLHQYAAARKYAALVGARLEVPSDSRWIQTIFGFQDPVWSRELSEVNDGAAGHGPTVEWGQVNVRLSGYFQTQEWVGRLSRRELRQWFTVRKDLVDRVCLPSNGYVAAHLRRGDYVNHPLYCTVSERSYVRAAERLGLNIDHWATQELSRPGPSGMEFLTDWILLMRASTLLRANSTFSWWAAALSNGDVYAPIVEDRVGEHDVEFAHGNWPRCADAARVGTRVDDLHLPD